MGNLDRIRHDQDLADGGFSVTNLGKLDKIRHDQDLADGGFSVTNLETWTGSDTIRSGWLRGGFSVTNLGNLDRIGAEGTHAPAGRSHVAKGHPWGPKAPSSRRERARPAGA